MTNGEIGDLLKVRRDKLENFREAGKDPFITTVYDRTHHSEDIKLNFDSLENKEVSVAGRMMFKRIMGKASFCNIRDLKGDIQIYVAKDFIGDESYSDFKKSDIGDIFGIKGTVFKTKTGEISIHAVNIKLLSKSLQILPEKFHGLTDVDSRYRQRYVDLIMNADVKETFIKRTKILRAIRSYMDERGFFEVETPVLVENAGGAAARPFTTHFNALNEEMKLRISLELPLKKLIVGGLEGVYEIGRVFRNEGLDTRHNPEFTEMEFYQAYTDYNGMMKHTEDMFKYIAKTVTGSLKLPFGDNIIDMESPWRVISMEEAVREYANVDFTRIKDTDEAKEIADKHGVEYEKYDTKGNILAHFFEEYAESHLIQPTFVIDHPIEISPLTKKKPGRPDLVERFELFINGWEFANAYSEINDPIDQRERFKAQESLLAAGDEEANTTDYDFINALDVGMPPTGGVGYGIDRLVMLMTNSMAIRDVLLFPTMKTLGGKEMPKHGGTNPAHHTEPEPIDFSNVEIEPLFKDFVDFETFSKSDFRAVKVLECEAVPKSKKLLRFTLDDGTGENRTILSGIHEYYEPEELVGKTCIAITNLPPRAMMGIDSCGMLISAIHSEEGKERINLLMVDNHIPAGAKLY